MKLRWIKFIVFAIVAFGAFIYTFKLADYKDRPATGYDEVMWTGSSIAAYNMFFKGYQRKTERLDNWFISYAQKYQLDTTMPPKQRQWFANSLWTFGWKSPNICKFLMGFSVVNFGKDVNPEGNFYYYTEDKALNKFPGNYTPEEQVYLARKMNAFLGALGIIIVFIIGWQFFNYLTGLIAALILLLNKYYILQISVALVESPSLFFSIITLYFVMCYLKYFKTMSLNITLLISFCIGLFFSFAVGSKFSAALYGYAIGICFVLLGIKLVFNLLSNEFNREDINKIKSRKDKKIAEDKLINKRTISLNMVKKHIIGGVIIIVTTFSSFWIFHPHLRSNTVTKVKIIQESIDYFFDLRAQNLGTKYIKDSFGESFKLFFKRNYIKIEDTYYGLFGKLLKFNYNPIDGLLVLIGLFLIFRLAFVEHKRTKQFNLYMFFIILYFIVHYGNIDFIWIDWDRYYVPVYPLNALLVGLVFATLINYLSKYFIKEKQLNQS